MKLGEDLSGGLFRRGYWPSNTTGLWFSISVAVVLMVLHQALQGAFVIAAMLFFQLTPGVTPAITKVALISIFPASLIVFALGYWLAGLRGGVRSDVLNMRWPRLTPLGWSALIIGFMLAMYAAIMLIVVIFHIDMSQYTPGPHGESPKSGSAGAVKEAMFDIANTPWLFALVFPSIAIGAPLAEELIFRGQLFSALSQTRLGVAGTTVLTAALWSLLHVTEPWLSIGLIFVMGLIFGWMMWRFGSLWVTVACHGFWNGFYALMIYFNVAGGP
jgi:membrane protease YdiL (CAAX protease family)